MLVGALSLCELGTCFANGFDRFVQVTGSCLDVWSWCQDMTVSASMGMRYSNQGAGRLHLLHRRRRRLLTC